MADDVAPELTGAAFDLANAGYTAMPDDPKEKQEADEIGGDSVYCVRRPSSDLPRGDAVVARKYVDGDGKTANANEAVTLDRAARDYAGLIAAENESSKELAARVDALRAAALAEDSEAADFYDFELPEKDSGKAQQQDEARQADAPTGPNRDPAAENLDPQLEKALQHPQVVQAIEERIGEVEKARQGYRDGLAAAMQITQASFLSQFPELAAVAPESLPGALELMSRQDPAKFARVKALVASSEQLLARQSQESRLQAEIARQNFHRFAQSEDARLEGMLKDEPKATQQAVITEIMASARASGIEPGELNRLFNTEPLMRNATFQRMMYDAGKYLKPSKNDEAVARCFDLVVENLEAVAETKRGDLAFDQAFGGLRQGTLRLANADRKSAALRLASFDQQLSEEMRFSRAAAAEGALVARRLQQRLKDPRCRYFQDRQ